MIGNVKDFDSFAKIWRKIEKFTRGEGIADVLLLKCLGNDLDIPESVKLAAAINHFMLNVATEEDRINWAKAMKPMMREEAPATESKSPAEEDLEKIPNMVDFEVT